MEILLSPEFINLLFGSGIALVVLRAVFTMGEFNNRFKTVEQNLKALTNSVLDLNKSVEEMEDSLEAVKTDVSKNKTNINKVIRHIDGSERIDKFTEQRLNFEITNSPIGLKPEYKKIVKKTGVDKEVEKSKKKITSWLKRQKPKNGLEAQNELVHLSMSGKIEKYLKLNDFYDEIYNQGYMLDQARTIIALYLFETIIPDFLKKQKA